jgi:hypothetical protein
MSQVPGIITSQQSYVTGWASQADAFINQVASLANIEFNPELTDGVGFEVTHAAAASAAALLALRPTRPEFASIDEGTIPDAPTIADLVLADIDIPTFTDAAPTLNIPSAPAPISITEPTAPTMSEPVYPTAPTIDLPAAPTLTAVAIPSAPSIELPPFTASAPIDDLVTPTNTFQFAEQAYQSALLDAAKAKLLDNLQNGGYGIEPSDEQALFERTRARELTTMAAEADTVLSSFASRGFPLPPGEAAVALAGVQQRAYDKVSAGNRDITLERSRLYVENRQFTLREARELEALLLQYHTAFMERSLNASRAVLDAAIAIFNTQIARYNARIQAYQTEAQIYESRIRAALSQVEIYRAQIQAANLALDVQKTGVDIYRTQLVGVQTLVDIYRARMEAANVQANVDRTRMEAFRARIDAYGQQVQAKVAEFTAFEAQVRGEVARMDGFRASVDAYRARADASKAKADVQIARASAETERARVQLTGYQVALEAARSRVDAQAKTISGQAEVYRADAAVAETAMNALARSYELQNRESESNIRWNLGVQESRVRVAIAKLDHSRTAAQLRLDASKFGADFYRAIVASTLGSINTLAATIESGSTT